MKKTKFKISFPGDDYGFDVKKVILKIDKKAIKPGPPISKKERKLLETYGGIGGCPDFQTISVVLALPQFFLALFQLYDRFEVNKFPFSLIVEQGKKKINIPLSKYPSSKEMTKIVDFFA